MSPLHLKWEKHQRGGDLVITSGSVRLEKTSTYIDDEGYPAAAHHEVFLALIMAADNLELPCHVGLTASASGFLAAETILMINEKR
ncbi:MAG: hypothetical protein BMS9Abin02_1141 [Anaerolineae bacterium]|nr:MAG: hypothetical protein BMS9Abin02_1141 [Anaerolineae bacterium]